MTAGAILGSTMVLMLTLASMAVGALFATIPRWDGVGCMSLMAAMGCYIIATHDWPRTWKPLLTGSKK